jgi:hypothetical protein
VRIVSLLPSATEIVYGLGLGGQLEGRTFECDYPPEAQQKPIVSSSGLPENLPLGEIDNAVRAATAGERSGWIWAMRASSSRYRGRTHRRSGGPTMFAIVRLNSFDPIKLAASPRWNSSTSSTGISPATSAPSLSTCKQVAAWCSISGRARRTARQRCRSSGPRSAGSWNRSCPTLLNSLAREP